MIHGTDRREPTPAHSTFRSPYLYAVLLLAILFGLAASPAPGGRYTLHTGQMLIQGQTQPITLRLDTVSGRCWLLGYLEAHGGVVHIWHQVDEIEEAIGLLQTQRTAPSTAPTDGKPATR